MEDINYLKYISTVSVKDHPTLIVILRQLNYLVKTSPMLREMMLGRYSLTQ